MEINSKYPLALSEGVVLAGQYLITKVLGQGGFGITYQATDHKTDRRVAIKEYFPDSLATRSQGQTTVMSFTGEKAENFEYGKQCFLQEAETLAQFIGNENIVRIYSYFEENGTAYFVMDYIEGTSLEDYIKQKGGKLSFEETQKFLVPVMDALGAVHEKGIVHRDVAPDNIYLTKDGKVKLIDFGAARQSLGDKSQSLDVVLKHGFAPKEQYSRRGRQGPYTDVYALGATYYFTLTGKRPPDSLERIDEDSIVLPSALGVKLPKQAEEAILNALNVRSEDRYQSMAAFKDAMIGNGEVKSRTAAAIPAHTTQQPVKQTFFDVMDSAGAQDSTKTSDNISAIGSTVSRLKDAALSSDAGKTIIDTGKKTVKRAVKILGIIFAVIGILFVILMISIMKSSGNTDTGTEAAPTEAPSEDASKQDAISAEVTDQDQEETTETSTENTEESVGTEEIEAEETEEKNLYPEIIGNTVGNLMQCGYLDSNGIASGDDTISLYSHSYRGEHYGLYDGIAYQRRGDHGDLIEIPELRGYSGIRRLFVSADYYFIQLNDDKGSLYCVSRKDGSEIGSLSLGNRRYTFLHGYLFYIDGQKLVAIPAGDFSSKPVEEDIRDETILFMASPAMTGFSDEDTCIYADGDVLNAVRYKDGAYWIGNWNYQLSKYNDYNFSFVNCYHEINYEGVVIGLFNDNEFVIVDISKEDDKIIEYDVVHIDKNDDSYLNMGNVSVSLVNERNETSTYRDTRYIQISFAKSTKDKWDFENIALYGYRRPIGVDAYGKDITESRYYDLGKIMNIN